MKIEIEPRLWFFRSQYEQHANTQVTDCLSLSHGATYEGSGYFTVPQGVTVHFFTPPGVPFKGNRENVTNLIMRDTHLPHEDVLGGRHCPNYLLTKVVGGHGAQDDYEGIEGLMVSALAGVKSHGYRRQDPRDAAAGAHVVRWAPHVVTVRARGALTWHAKGISLRELIDCVRRRHNYITDFYVAACRVHAVVNGFGNKKVEPHLAPKPY